MRNEGQLRDDTVPGAIAGAESTSEDYVTMGIGGQTFGIPVLNVRDVLGPQNITRVPLAPEEIAGSLNLRGRIVTAVNMRKRLGLPSENFVATAMAVVVEHEDEPFSLLVDEVGEVLSLQSARREAVPATLDARWRDVTQGIYRLDDRLLIVLGVADVLRTIRTDSI
ncbi:chemotaxis protein CheW [Parvibaculum sp.]|uniref:chemotaxis protein CheW n=1 Tax=Parvibaculum sp. TaxID=2024848 RepID=UPI00272F9947|nr:chemotaxis protein CheW [Parvibaculum sp.]MDP1626256.1 chemotaxis protein CheW [Parvibaculum sp.]MDP2151574.1 chemotaxis protein CheW [Parvibaculum sp.]MDP3329015.1 chemotaxis protein CheW [Parvibaculum sp.]